MRALRSSEWRDLFAAQFAVIIAQLSVKFRRRGTLISFGRSEGGSERGVPLDSTVEATARAIDRVARYGLIRARCLVRSVALSRMLRSRGYDGAVVRVGVYRANDEMMAHAWVEYQGVVVGDDETHVSRFSPLSEIHVDVGL